jgi:acyl-CoA synthetase (AMP-forming)/AMP-acid ligase II
VVTLLQTELLADLASAHPEGVAWRNLADGAELTLESWHRDSNRLAAGLADVGVRPGDRVGLVISDDEPLHWLVSYMAVHKAGAINVPLLARTSPAEQVAALGDAGASALLCTTADAAVAATVRTVVSTSGTGSMTYAGLLAREDRGVPVAPRPDDVADIVYTSGTTGRPKGVVVRHASLSTTSRAPSAWLGLGFLTSSPFATTSGSLLVCGPARGGLSGWFLPRFDAARWLDVVQDRRPVAAFLVPTMAELIVASSGFEVADLSSLAVVNVGSAPIASATLRRLGERLERGEVLCGYGMTECGAVTSMPPGDGGRHLGAVGTPLPGVELKIVDDAGLAVPAGTVGQVAIGGTRPSRAYLDDDDALAGARWVDGWLMSGDLGYLDDDGFLWIVGRAKELIVRGGHNIAPAEVEAALFEHPAVAEAAVAGVPHPVLGEDVAAWVVLRDRVPVADLRTFLSARLSDYKVPRRITVVDALPRNEAGKVRKAALVTGAAPGSTT